MVSNTSTAVILLKCLLLIACPIFITAADDCAENSKDEKCITNYNLPPGVVPMHYDIWLNLYMSGAMFGGETNITIKVLYATQYISLHLLKLEIYQRETKLINHENGTIYTPMEHKYRDPQVLILYFTNTLIPGFYTLCFKYDGYFSQEGGQGFLRVPHTKLSHDIKWMLISQFGKIGARRVFPCWDEPALRATFNITVKHHSQYSVFSTMPRREEKNFSTSVILSYFERTPVMSTYFLGIAMLAVRRCNNDNIFQIWCTENLNVTKDFVQSVGQQYRRIAVHLTQYTNTSMKIPKLDIIIVPDHVPTNSTIWGMLLMKESQLIIDKNNEIQKINLTSFLAHEMARQWLLSISPTWWSDIWLNNGIALYLKVYILSQIYKEWRIMDFLTLSLQKCLHLDDMLTKKNLIFYTESTHETHFIESFIVADKTLVLLHMLKFLISDKVFRNGISVYLERHQFVSATPNAFWDCMQYATEESTEYSIDIKPVMRIWLNQTTYPLIKVKRNYEFDEYDEITISQAHYGTTKVDQVDRMWIPVTFATYSSPKVSDPVPTIWLRNDMALILSVASSNWIIVNLQQAGYYRVNYDARNWEKIGACLNSDEVAKIDVINRAQIIDDAYHFVVQKRLDSFIFLHITKYLSKEVDYIAWFPMFRILSYLWKFFLLPFKEPAVLETLKTHILDILNGLLKNIGYHDDFVDTNIKKLLRGTALEWACSLGDSFCEKLALDKFNERIKNFEQFGTILPWERWIYCTGLKAADLDTWNKVMTLYLKTHQDIILELATCSEKPDVVIHYVGFLHVTVDNSVITRKQHSHIFDILISKYSRNNEVLDYVVQNLEKVKPRSYSRSMALKQIISNMYSEEQLNKMHNCRCMKQYADIAEEVTTTISTRLIQLHEMMDNFLDRFAGITRKRWIDLS